uniref:Uncharacterized protein n=1 Tax=viral metagenome TaxID=1070528 RepID=A0A6M3JLH4_9ZZZZ
MAKLDPWIKVKTVHVLDEYNDLSDKEFRVWIKLMALTCRLEHIPTQQQMLNQAHYKTLKSLNNTLMTHSTTLQDILNKVLIDVQDMLKNREHQKQKMQEYRARTSPVTGNVTVTLPSREEKRREEKNIKNKERGFHPPSVDDILAYCKERKNTVNPQTFVDHYESNGWMVGKNKMKDWKAAVRNWETRGGYDDGRRGTRDGGGGPGVSATLAEWKGSGTALSPEQVAENLRRVSEITGGAG